MSARETVVVVGLGEVGRPLRQLAARVHDVVGLDVTPAAAPMGRVDVMHVCYPYEIADFVGETARYIDRLRPRLTIIDSTVAVGTTREVADRTGGAVVHSPVRGKHTRMQAELLRYTKYIGALDPDAGESAAVHLQSMGMKTHLASCPEATELAKLTETTYFGLLIAWAQEVERQCDRLALRYDEVVPFFDEIGFFPPVRYVPGVIGGHCVMPNLAMLRSVSDSEMLRAIESSNRMKIEREALPATGAR